MSSCAVPYLVTKSPGARLEADIDHDVYANHMGFGAPLWYCYLAPLNVVVILNMSGKSYSACTMRQKSWSSANCHPQK